MKSRFFVGRIVGLIQVVIWILSWTLALFSHSSEAAISTYDKFFPYYVKSCAESPIKRLGERKPKGYNYWGHSILFLKGVCKDPHSSLPRIKMCDDLLDMTDSDSGTVISVTRAVKNAAWVAIPGGGAFAFHGDLSEGQHVNHDSYQKVYDRAMKSGLFRDLIFHDRWKKNAEERSLSIEEHMAVQTLGADYAVDFARTSYCHSFPMTRGQIETMVNFLNQVNEPYLMGEKVFEWRWFGNNCQDLVNHALTTVGIKKQTSGLTSPASEYMTDADEVLNGYRGMDVISAFRDLKIRESFETLGRPPLTHGRMISVIPMRASGNEIFSSVPVIYSTQFSVHHSRFAELTAESRLRNLRSNLKHFHTRYLILQKKLPSLEVIYKIRKYLNGPEFEEFYGLYLRWLQGAISEVEGMLDQLEDPLNARAT